MGTPQYKKQKSPFKMEKMMAGIGAQLRAIGPALQQTLPKPPYIVLAAQGTATPSARSGMTTSSAQSGIYVPIYMHKYLHVADDASKGGVIIFAFVKGPVNQERHTVRDSPKGSVITYTAGLFEGDYPPRIKPPPGVRDPLTGAPSRDIRTEPALIVTFEIAAVRKITVDLGFGVAIGATAKPALALPTTRESFYMDAQSWWAATSGVRQKLRGGTVTFLQDLAEMRDLREALTLKVLRGNNAADFSGSYVPVRYFKMLGPPGGGSHIVVVLLNKERGGPANENMVSAVAPQGGLAFYDPRFFFVRPGDGALVPKQGAINPGAPLVFLEITLKSSGGMGTIEMGLARFRTEMRKTDTLTLLRFNEASWQAAESNTGARGSSVDTQFEVEVKSSKGNLRILR
jgi:hypothetical protein